MARHGLRAIANGADDSCLELPTRSRRYPLRGFFPCDRFNVFRSRPITSVPDLTF
jgi:hypothetical protein